MNDDRTDHQVIRDLLVEILGELKVANRIAIDSATAQPQGILFDDLQKMREAIKDIRLEYGP